VFELRTIIVSSKGSIVEACQTLQKQDLDIGCLTFKDIYPMDSKIVKNLISGKKIIMVEQNANCQMGKLIAQQTGILYDEAILKYDGRPLYPEYIIERTKQIMEG